MKDLKIDKWYLRSSGDMDYFKIETSISEKQIMYMNCEADLFNDTQRILEGVVNKHNELINLVNPLIKAAVMNCESDNSFKLSESRIALRKSVIKIKENEQN